MNCATKVQPDAGHGNGSVRTQYHPVRSAPVSSVQRSSSSTSTRSSSRSARPCSIAVGYGIGTRNGAIAVVRSGLSRRLSRLATELHPDRALLGVAVELEGDRV